MKKQQIIFGTLDFINQRLNEGWYIKQVIKIKEYEPLKRLEGQVNCGFC